MGELKKIIGIEISHTENTITISQQCYTKSILKCENSTDCNLISTSMDLKIKSQHLNGTKIIWNNIFQLSWRQQQSIPQFLSQFHQHCLCQHRLLQVYSYVCLHYVCLHYSRVVMVTGNPGVILH
jgi:hypothetical protein